MGSNGNELIYLSLGSNLGNREKNLRKVEKELPPLVKVIEKSSIYETEPWGYHQQPFFLNQVLCVQSSLVPYELLDYIKSIEKKVGRKPSFLYGPREVDVDILIYGERLIDDEVLSIPHQRLQERAFVLVPLAEIAPDLILPGSDQLIKDLLAQVDKSVVTLYQEL